LQNTLYFQNKKILILDSLGVYPKNTKPDIVVLTQSPKINLDRMFQILKPQIVVADGSNYRTYISLWKATCLKNKIPFHVTGEKGFYKIN
jgi:competence protein ComEC